MKEPSQIHSSYDSDMFVGWEMDDLVRMAGKITRKKTEMGSRQTGKIYS
jgi:hypothetical protein